MNDMLKKAVQKMQEKNGNGDMASGMKKAMDTESKSEDKQEIECPHCGKGITIEVEQPEQEDSKAEDSKEDE